MLTAKRDKTDQGRIDRGRQGKTVVKVLRQAAPPLFLPTYIYAARCSGYKESEDRGRWWPACRENAEDHLMLGTISVRLSAARLETGDASEARTPTVKKLGGWQTGCE